MCCSEQSFNSPRDSFSIFPRTRVIPKGYKHGRQYRKNRKFN
jgi:hypothetical protein